jgi:hypothetical protein
MGNMQQQVVVCLALDAADQPIAAMSHAVTIFPARTGKYQ